MRIDYSEPKQACVKTQSMNRPRKEPAGLITTIVIITGVITFIIGFGSGWLLSQRSAKKAFQAATEQQSLESSPKQENTPAPAKVQQQVPQPAVPAQLPQTGAPNVQTASGSQPTPEPQLCFYKTLPSGQKNNVMGSGINAKDDKVKQPLQAAIPSNMVKPAQQGAEPAKPATEKPLATPDKSAVKHDNSGFTVQLASYSLKSEAETLKTKLAGKGYNVSIVESNQGDKGTWYRVRVGRKLAQDAAKELAGKLGKGAIVIPDGN
jgi:cell division septation protein DedD